MIDTKELCSKLGIHKNTLYSYVSDGLPTIRLKHKLLFDYEKVIKWLEERDC